jgi:hypothetical protein
LCKKFIMTMMFTLLCLILGQSDSEVKISLRVDPAKPIADGATPFALLATVTDGKGRPVTGATVRFQAHGYLEAPDGTIIGTHNDMKRGVDYRVILAGGLLSGDPKRPITNSVDVKTDEKGIARVLYKPGQWTNFMEKVATRVTAWHRVDGTGQRSVATDISFTKPKN